MPYKSFTLPKLKERFGLHEQRTTLFANITPVQPGAWLETTLQFAVHNPPLTEKAKSEAIVYPLLAEVCRSTNYAFRIFSGVPLNADAHQELVGECDFILSHRQTHFLESAVFAVVEAKNDNLDESLGQCAAQMLGAQIFNAKHSLGDEPSVIYGCVTNSDEWQFLKLEERTISIDNRKYPLVNAAELIGVIRYIVDQYTPS
jgi:hypothetical protein